MNQLSCIRFALILATIVFLGWTVLNTAFWPVEDYADVTHAYAESTNQIVRGMSIGVASYISAVAMIAGWALTNNKILNISSVAQPVKAG